MMCVLDLTYYPFDLQKCPIEIENWAYSGQQVHLVNKTSGVPQSNYRENGVWEISGSSVDRSALYYDFNPGVPYPRLTFRILLSRKFSYYGLNLLLPNLLLLLISLGLFWVPTDSGEKISLGITTMLAFSVYQLLISESIPENSDYTPILSELYYYITSFCFRGSLIYMCLSARLW